MAELVKIPTTNELLDNPEFQKALEKLDDPQPGKEVAGGTPAPSTPDGGSREAASATPALPERVTQETPAPEPAQQTEQATEESWINQDMIALAESYGISEDRLRRFSSREDFDNVASFLDDQLRGAPKQDDSKRKVDPLSPPEQPDPAATEASKEAPSLQGAQKAKTEEVEQFDIEALRKEGYDENSLKLFEKVNEERRARAELEKKFEQVNQYVSAQQEAQQAEMRRAQQAQMYEFHSQVDKLSESRFGRAIDDHGRFSQITAEQRDNRARLGASLMTIANNIQESGRPMPPWNVLLQRAEAFEFSKELVAEEAQKIKDGLRQQSAMRRPTGTPKAVNGLKPPGPGASHNESRDFILSSPEFSRLYAQLEAEAGSR